MLTYTILLATPHDLPAIRDLFYEALTNTSELKELGKEATLQRPELSKYILNWGREGDRAIVAVDDNENIIGAAWYRLFTKDNPSYGYVAGDIPELSLSVTSSARDKGVGTRLLEKLIESATDDGFRALSLSVDKKNDRALHLYEKLGFRDAKVSIPKDTSRTLLKEL